MSGPVAALLVAAACSGSSRSAGEAELPGSDTCQVTLPEREAPIAESAPASSTRARSRSNTSKSKGPSYVVVHAEASLVAIARELERRIDRRLANVRGADAGVAGRINYTVDRGPLSVTVEKGAFVVRTNVRANAEVCARGRCYASCKPTATAQARVPLELRPDFRFARPRVTIAMTRGCKIRTLGGFLTVDVTPTIERQVDPTLRRVERDIIRNLPDLRAEAKRIWPELSEGRKVPLLGCITPRPKGVVQGPIEADGDVLRMRFALEAEPELRPACDAPDEASPLPRLRRDPALGKDGELRLSIVTPLSAVASAFQGMAPVDVGGAPTSVQHASVVANERLQADLVLAGGVCGDVSLLASPGFSADQRSVVLTDAELSSGEDERVRAASLDPELLARAVARAPEVRLPIDVTALGTAVPGLVRSLSQNETVEVAVTIARVRPLDVVLHQGELAAIVGVAGRVVLRER